ncbi:hypothetical protein, partial [Pedobacter sp.]|uniref:hypothetical protein n=1 Tax=Pedobacter sp. TaxID=1411316 RepID=UPI003D7F20BE
GWIAFSVNLIIFRKVKHGYLSKVASIFLLYFNVVNSCTLLFVIQFSRAGQLRIILFDEF